MVTYIDALIIATILVSPFITVLYALMLTVADSIIAAVRTLGDDDEHT